ncbi:MAG: LysR family transcriptional regulator [Acidobacteriota bacterium]
MRGSSIALGPGKVALLEAIARTGALAEAARSLSMSYKRAWDLVETMNAEFRDPLVVTKVGGAGGGGATLTDTGAKALRLYLSMKQKSERAIAGDARRLERLLR